MRTAKEPLINKKSIGIASAAKLEDVAKHRKRKAPKLAIA